MVRPFFVLALLGCSLAADAHFSKSSEVMCAKQAALRARFAKHLSPGLDDPQPITGLSNTDVIKNFLTIQPNFTNSSLTGSNEMTVKSKVDGLTSMEFELDSVFTITGMTLDGRTITATRLDSKTVRANFDQAYNTGQQFVLKISYNGVPNSSFFGSIEFYTHSGQSAVSTLSEPYYAYTWWPVKEDNTDKAILDIDIIVPTAMLACSSGVRTGITVLGGGLRKHSWRGTNPMAPYLVSFSATNYTEFTDTFTGTGGPMPLQFFVFPENNTTTVQNIWKSTKNMIATYQNFYGPYPFLNEKYGIYQFPFSGGMEHQTMTGQGGGGLSSESVTCHELSHQWWGDNVTCATWSDIWLNEGFATYSEVLWYEWKTGTQNFTQYKTSMNSRKPSSVGDSVYCYNTSDPNRIFSSTYSYAKGAWILHMLRHIMGDTAFFAGMQNYRNKYAYSTATTDNFAQVMEDTCGIDLTPFFTAWVYGIGAPAYQWGWSSTTVNGKNYLLVRINQNQVASYPIFPIPIDIRATISGSPVTFSVNDTAKTQYFVVPISAPATACSFDPDVWTLNTSVTNQTYSPGPPKIVETSPRPYARMGTAPTSISVTFHTPVTTNASHFTLLRGAAPVACSFAYNSSTNTVTLTPNEPLGQGDYALNISDNLTATNSGQKLDGEIVGSTPMLPSGDGLQGGNAVLTFNVVSKIGAPPLDPTKPKDSLPGTGKG